MLVCFFGFWIGKGFATGFERKWKLNMKAFTAECPCYDSDYTVHQRHLWNYRTYTTTLQHTVKFRKYTPPSISPSKNKPQTGNAKYPLLNRPSKYKPPGVFYCENCPQIQSKTK